MNSYWSSNHSEGTNPRSTLSLNMGHKDGSLRSWRFWCSILINQLIGSSRDDWLHGSHPQWLRRPATILASNLERHVFELNKRFRFSNGAPHPKKNSPSYEITPLDSSKHPRVANDTYCYQPWEKSGTPVTLGISCWGFPRRGPVEVKKKWPSLMCL